MARHRVNATFASLARRRPELVSAHFGLSYLMIESNASHAAARAASPINNAADSGGRGVVESRVGDPVAAPRAGARADAGTGEGAAAAGRVAHGQLGFAVPKRHLALAVDRNALKRVAREAWRNARWGAEGRPRAAMLKLRRAEPQWKTAPRSALKKLWRAELDELFARLPARLARARADASRSTEPPRAAGKPASNEQPRPKP